GGNGVDGRNDKSIIAIVDHNSFRSNFNDVASSTTKLATSPSHLPLQLHSSQERLKQSPQLRTMLNTSPDTESHNSSELIQIYNSEVAPIVSISSDDGGG
ncbi:24056_t:CDS:2, partial [Entrophospora sp. SA101]